MNRKIPLIVFAVVVAVAFLISLQPDSSVEFDQFQARFYKTLQIKGFTDLTPREPDNSGTRFAPKDVAVPVTVRWNPHRWYPHTADTVPIGFPEKGFQWHHKIGNGSSMPIICSVVFIDGRASLIVIRGQGEAMSLADSLRIALLQEFPGLTIKLEPNA
jgi:hypothetical protein